VVLGADLFAGAAHITQLDLLSLFRHGSQGRHDVVVAPQASPGMRAWLTGLSPRTRDEVLGAQFSGPARRTDSRVMITIDGRRQDDWINRRFSVQTGARLMEMPLYLLVEDWESDGGFLHALLTYLEHVAARQPAHVKRAQCEQVSVVARCAFRRGWAVAEHGGGTTVMKRRLDGVAAGRDAAIGLRMWMMTDGDDGVDENHALAERCGVPSHKLRRHEIENYLPLGRLEAHVSDNRLGVPLQRALRESLAAFRILSHEERCGANVKKLFDRDVSPRPEGRNAHDGFKHSTAHRYRVETFPAREWDNDPAPQGVEVLDEALEIFTSILARR
jgi:hypothetical protein